MNQDFIAKQRRKFNLRHDFHDVFVQNGWHGIQESSNPDVIPYEKYVLDGGARPVLVNATFNFPIITSIDNQEVKIKCRNAFDCFVHLVMNGNEFEAAQHVANLIPDNNEPVVVNVITSGGFEDIIHSLPLVISPIESETYPDHSVKRLVPSNVFGDARWKTITEIRATGLISDIGIPIGFIKNEYGQLEKLSYTGEKNLLTIAQIGTGKNTAVQIPVLLQYDSPIFCIDPKGENALVTARYRKEVMGHDVVVINPFEIRSARFDMLGIPQVGFNPLASIKGGKDFSTHVYALCDLLIESEGSASFWDNAPKSLLSALIMYVCKTNPPAECNLIEVRNLLMQDINTLMTKTLPLIASNTFPAMADNAKSFLKSSKTVDCVILVTKIIGIFLHDEYLSDSLSVHGDKNVDFSAIRRSENKNMTVYLVVPSDKISNYQRWFRMVVHMALTIMKTEYKDKTATKKVLMMVDECKNIGYLKSLEDVLAEGRGTDIQVWCFFQNYDQIKTIYSNPNGFLSAAGIQQFFTANDPATAELISNRIGNTTSFSTSYNCEPKKGAIQSFTLAEVQQPFFSTNQAYGLGREEQIIFISGFKNPVFGVKEFYYENPTLKKRADWNPYSLENQYDLFDFN